MEFPGSGQWFYYDRAEYERAREAAAAQSNVASRETSSSPVSDPAGVLGPLARLQLDRHGSRSTIDDDATLAPRGLPPFRSTYRMDAPPPGRGVTRYVHDEGFDAQAGAVPEDARVPEDNAAAAASSRAGQRYARRLAASMMAAEETTLPPLDPLRQEPNDADLRLIDRMREGLAADPRTSRRMWTDYPLNTVQCLAESGR